MRALSTTNTLVAAGLLVSLFTGCGAAVPLELVSARTEVQRIGTGPTAVTNPAGLHTAKQTLGAAEHSYEEEGDTQETKDLAYTAERRAQTAEVKGRELAWKQETERTKEQMEKDEAARLASTSEQLVDAKTKLQQQEQQLIDERERRAEEKKEKR